jgi:hypothetical protein
MFIYGVLLKKLVNDFFLKKNAFSKDLFSMVHVENITHLKIGLSESKNSSSNSVLCQCRLESVHVNKHIIFVIN